MCIIFDHYFSVKRIAFWSLLITIVLTIIALGLGFGLSTTSTDITPITDKCDMDCLSGLSEDCGSDCYCFDRKCFSSSNNTYLTT